MIVFSSNFSIFFVYCLFFIFFEDIFLLLASKEPFGGEFGDLEILEKKNNSE